MLILETPRLYFRQFTCEDAGLLIDLDSDPEVMRFITLGKPTPAEKIVNEILPRMLSYYEKFKSQGAWAVHLKSDSEFIGWYHLRPDVFEPEHQELGYRLKRQYWGHGYATEGTRALVDHAFRKWNVPTITARTLKANLPSQRVLLKTGLQPVEEFIYPEDHLPGATETDRAAIKFMIVRKHET